MRRRFFVAAKFPVTGFCLALGAAALLVLAFPSSARDSGAGDTTADRELGQTDLVHNMLNFRGAAALTLANPAQIGALAAHIAIDAGGHLYLADAANSRVLGWTSAAAFANGDPAALVIGQPDFFSYGCDDGTAPGDAGGLGADSLCGPRGVAVDGAGNLYVADTADNRVLGYDQPFSSGRNAGQSATMVFGQGGSFTAIAAGAGPDGLNTPAAAAVDPDGNLYVADGANNRVLEYLNPRAPGGGTPGTPGTAGDTTADAVAGQDGSFTRVGCNDGTAAGDVSGLGPDSLCRPTGLALEDKHKLYVADYDNSRALEYLLPLGGDALADFVFGQNGSFTTQGCDHGAAGAGADSLCHPAAAALDSKGNLYIADADDNRVLEYGAPLSASASRVFGQSGSFTALECNARATAVSADTLCAPNGLTLDSADNLYVADSGNNRLLEYNQPLAPGTPTPTPSATPTPSPTPTATPTGTPSPTPTPTPAPTPSPSPTPTPLPPGGVLSVPA